MDNFKILYVKPKSLLRELIQKLFLKLLLKLFPNKFLTYKNKIRSIMNKSGYYISLGLVIIYLRFKYPHYISLPSRHIYALHILIKFLEVLKRQKINFFGTSINCNFVSDLLTIRKSRFNTRRN